MKFRVFCFSVFIAVFGLGAGTVTAADKVVIGIVTDGPTEGFTKIHQLFLSEITSLTAGEFDIQFPEQFQLDGQWSSDLIEQAINSLQNDPEVDMVLTLGFVSSLVASRLENFNKPTFAPLVLDSNLLNLPRNGNISGVNNLNYITEEVRFTDDVQSFREITPFQNLALIVDATIFESVPELAEQGKAWAADLGIELTYVLNEDENEDVVAKIPDEVQAVMVAAVPRLNESAKQQLIYHLKQENLPSYSLIGTTPVENGLLAATAPDSDWNRMARKNALNIQSVLLGENAGDQSVTFKNERRLTINMETARDIGIYPRYDVLSTANLLNEVDYSGDTTWTLSEVAFEALKSNLDIQSSIAGVQAGAENVNQASALKLPQFDSGVSITETDGDSASVQSGAVAETQSAASITGTQIIYSESANAAVDIEQGLQLARESAHRAVELDIIQQATVAFLNVLQVQTLVDIRKSSLDLSRSNLALARDRVQQGAVTAVDIYRWEAEVATARQNLLEARAEFNQARDALNVLLHRPINELFQTEPASLSDQTLLVSRNELLEIIDNPRSFRKMGELMVIQGKQNAPELKQLDYQIAALQRQLKSEERAYWSPDVNLAGQIDHIIDESPNLINSYEGESNWQVGITLSLPLFEGGARKSRINQSTYELQQLYFDKLATEDLIEQGIRQYIHDVEASYPSIELTRLASDAAAKNLELVQENYTQGSMSVIELIDARDESLSANLNATNAVYEFLTDLMNLQRAAAEFDFFLEPEEITRTVEQIRYYISTPE